MKVLPYCFAVLISSASVSAMAEQGGYGPNMDRMQQRFENMDQMMGQARNSKDQGKRQRYIMQHMDMMQEQMRDMRGMMGGGMWPGGRQGNMDPDEMMGSGSRGGMMGSNGGPGNYQMMEKRLDYMQRMMEQVIDQQRMMMRQ